MEKKCSKCGKIKTAINTNRKNKSRSFIMVNEFGRSWHGSSCPDCRQKYNTSYSRAQGIPAYGDGDYLPHKRGRWAENIACSFFKNLGFNVQQTTKTGPDLIISTSDLYFLVEVKLITLRKQRNKIYAQCRHISDKRKNDDFIAMVSPCGKVLVESMKKHLKKCYSNGSRYLGEYEKNVLSSKFDASVLLNSTNSTKHNPTKYSIQI